MSQSQKIWFRQPGEGPIAWDLFWQYLDMERRSYQTLANQTGRSLGLISRVAARHNWRARVKAFDTHMIKVRQRAMERAEADEAVKQALRVKRYKEDAYQIGMRLKDRILEMIDHPLFEDEVLELTPMNVDGQSKMVVTRINRVPVKWSQRDIPYFIENLNKLMATCLELETSRVTLNVNNNLSDPEQRRALARMSLDKLRTKVNSLVEQMVALDPNLDPSVARQFVTSQLPQWVSEDLETPIEELAVEETQGQPLLLTEDNREEYVS
jgi:hypothetical protein